MPGIGDICRFVDHPADEHVAAFLRRVRHLSSDERAAVRDQLEERDCYTVLMFARRQSASAIRYGDLNRALDAFSALTLITMARIDFRDFSADFPLYAIGRLGGDTTAAISAAMSSSETEVRKALASRVGRATRLTLRDCGLMEVRSRYGLGFMETWSEPYAPKADLAGASIRMADWIDAGGRYVVGGLHVSRLPEIWFDREFRRTGHVPTTGCVSFHAWVPGQAPFGHRLLAFVAEVESPETAMKLARRADAASVQNRPSAAGSRGPLLLVLIGGSATLGQAATETVDSLQPVCEALLAALD